MKNNPFGDIKKKANNFTKDEFVESAKVDGKNKSENIQDKNERRGSSYINKETGERIKLSGKILQVPVNGYELKILEDNARKMGLPIGSYLRSIGINWFNKKSQ